MLSEAKNAELLTEWASHIESAECRAAFHLLLGVGANIAALYLFPAA